MPDHARPFLKWAGGKFRLLHEILPRLPRGRRFIEPFAGSAAVSLNAVPLFSELVVADSNFDLINLYRQLQSPSDCEQVIDLAAGLCVPENNTEGRYYHLRRLFNALAPGEDPALRSALVIYLNRHGYNGLWRKSRGRRQFNVPFGRYQAPYFPEAELRQFGVRLRRCQFLVAGFDVTLADAGAGDIVYCDPPYLPLSASASFTAYDGQFGIDTQRKLKDAIYAAAGRGAFVLLSNHDTPATRRLYADANALHAIKVHRGISCKAAGRKPAPELLVEYRPS